MTRETKRCARCRQTKTTNHYTRHKETLDQLQAWCRECKTTDMRLRRARAAT